MFVERLKEKFGENKPIFTYEILDAFKEYTKAYVFRLLNKAIQNDEIMKHSTGVYYIPKKTVLGYSKLLPDKIITKKYIKNNDEVYGIYGGIYLENILDLTTQVPNIIEIISNNESTRSRRITIDGREFILKKSRCEITKDNYKEYILLELLSKKKPLMDIDTIKKYVEDNSIEKENLLETAKCFPSITFKNLLNFGIL